MALGVLKVLESYPFRHLVVEKKTFFELLRAQFEMICGKVGFDNEKKE